MTWVSWWHKVKKYWAKQNIVSIEIFEAKLWLSNEGNRIAAF